MRHAFQGNSDNVPVQGGFRLPKGALAKKSQRKRAVGAETRGGQWHSMYDIGLGMRLWNLVRGSKAMARDHVLRVYNVD